MKVPGNRGILLGDSYCWWVKHPELPGNVEKTEHILSRSVPDPVTNRVKYPPINGLRNGFRWGYFTPLSNW